MWIVWNSVKIFLFSSRSKELMGAKVSGFFKDVAKSAAKGATSFVLGKVPIIGAPVANWINSKYAHGGKVHHGEFHLRADGGLIPPAVKDMPVKPINTASQLIATIKQFPEEAKKAGLTVQDVKAAVAAPEAPVQKKRGGRRKKSESDKMKRGGRRMTHVPAAFKHGGQLYEHHQKILATPSIF